MMDYKIHCECEYCQADEHPRFADWLAKAESWDDLEQYLLKRLEEHTEDMLNSPGRGVGRMYIRAVAKLEYTKTLLVKFFGHQLK